MATEFDFVETDSAKIYTAIIGSLMGIYSLVGIVLCVLKFLGKC